MAPLRDAGLGAGLSRRRGLRAAGGVSCRTVWMRRTGAALRMRASPRRLPTTPTITPSASTSTTGKRHPLPGTTRCPPPPPPPPRHLLAAPPLRARRPASWPLSISRPQPCRLPFPTPTRGPSPPGRALERGAIPLNRGGYYLPLRGVMLGHPVYIFISFKPEQTPSRTVPSSEAHWAPVTFPGGCALNIQSQPSVICVRLLQFQEQKG